MLGASAWGIRKVLHHTCFHSGQLLLQECCIKRYSKTQWHITVSMYLLLWVYRSAGIGFQAEGLFHRAYSDQKLPGAWV